MRIRAKENIWIDESGSNRRAVKIACGGGWRLLKVGEARVLIPLDLHADRWTLEHNKIKRIL